MSDRCPSRLTTRRKGEIVFAEQCERDVGHRGACLAKGRPWSGPGVALSAAGVRHDVAADRTCIRCTQWFFCGGNEWYSEDTPASDWSSGCRLGVWKRGVGLCDEASFRAYLSSAKACSYYEETEP
jgi:hypothetical protein